MRARSRMNLGNGWYIGNGDEDRHDNSETFYAVAGCGSQGVGTRLSISKFGSQKVSIELVRYSERCETQKKCGFVFVSIP